jgi:flagellar assembly protein FliH
MTAARQPSLPAVLRGVLLHAQPHALLRPAPTDRESVLPLRHTEPEHRRHRRHEPEHGTADSAAYDEGFAEGHKLGYVVGRQAALAEQGASTQAAVAEARSLAAEEGRLQGLAIGRQEAQAEARRAQVEAQERFDQTARARLERLDGLLKAVTSDTSRRLEEAEEDLVALSHEALCRVLGAHAVKPECLHGMVSSLLAQHGQRKQLAVHVHPDDLAALGLEPDEARAPAWSWVGDSSVQLGGVVLRSPQGSLDARLETQMAGLRTTLLDARRERRDSLQKPAPLPGPGGAA